MSFRTELFCPQKLATHTFRAAGPLQPEEGPSGGGEGNQKGDGLKGMSQFPARLSEDPLIHFLLSNPGSVFSLFRFKAYPKLR